MLIFLNLLRKNNTEILVWTYLAVILYRMLPWVKTSSSFSGRKSTKNCNHPRLQQCPLSAQHTEFALLKVPITEGEKVVLKLVYTLHSSLNWHDFLTLRFHLVSITAEKFWLGMYKWLLNKPYVNMVILERGKISLKCCQPHEQKLCQ